MLWVAAKFPNRPDNFRSASPLRLLFHRRIFGVNLSPCPFSMFDLPASLNKDISSGP